jgi:hypothetical protein
LLISARHRLQVRPDNGIEVTSRSDRGGPLALLPQLRYPLTGIVVSLDGGYLAAFYGKGQVRVMRLRRRRCRRRPLDVLDLRG